MSGLVLGEIRKGREHDVMTGTSEHDPADPSSDVDETELEAMQRGAGQQDGSSVCTAINADRGGTGEMIR